MTFLHDDLVLTQLLINSTYMENEIELFKQAQEANQAASVSIVNKLINNLHNQLFSSTAHTADITEGKFFDKDLLNLNNFIAAIFRDITKFNGAPIVHHKDDILPPNTQAVEFGDYKINPQGFVNLLNRLRQEAESSNNQLLKLRIANLVQEMSQHKELATLLTSTQKEEPRPIDKESPYSTQRPIDKVSPYGKQKSKMQQVSYQQEGGEPATQIDAVELMPFRQSVQGIFSISDIKDFFDHMLNLTKNRPEYYDERRHQDIKRLVSEWTSMVGQVPNLSQQYKDDIDLGAMTVDKIYDHISTNFGIYTKRALQILQQLAMLTSQTLKQILTKEQDIMAMIGKDNISQQISLAEKWYEAFRQSIYYVK